MTEIKTINLTDLGLKVEHLETKMLYSGETKKIEIKKYYDLDGRIIDEGTEVVKFDKPTTVNIVSDKIRHTYPSPDMLSYEFESWKVSVDGKRVFEDLEITSYKVLKTKIVFEGCTGAG